MKKEELGVALSLYRANHDINSDDLFVYDNTKTIEIISKNGLKIPSDDELQELLDAHKSNLSDATDKLAGFEFDGTMCSATKEDQNGLVAILIGFQSGLITKTLFEFNNGNTLIFTPDNINDFAQKWSVFRQQFFVAE